MSNQNGLGKSRSESTLVAGQDLVLDAALTRRAEDRFDHNAIAKVVAGLAVNAQPPLNIALWGPWGSGKSSFLSLLSQAIQTASPDRRIRVVRYDAWKYGGRALKKHFVRSVSESLEIKDEAYSAGLDHDHQKTKLRLDKNWLGKNWRSLRFGLLLALGIAVLWYFAIAGVYVLANLGDQHHWGYRFGAAFKFATSGVSSIFGLAFAALVVGPRMLESASVTVSTPAPQTDDEFAARFQALVKEAVNVDKDERLVIFIDELDRCTPQDVVATLIDLKTFLDVPGCIFVVAADRDVLEQALTKVPQATPVRDDEPYYSTPGAFLDKIFQHRIPLPPLRAQALTKFARELVQDQGGIWADLRAKVPEDRLFLRVIYALIPAHVRSPRRAKVLLNNYATTVRIAEARGIDWLSRAEELACLTVLETEFPKVAADLVKAPLLLTFIRDENQNPGSPEIQQIVDAYRLIDPAGEASVPSEGQAAGELLPSGRRETEDLKQARQRTNRAINAQLRSYLRKVAAQRIPDPRPDLFYLQSAGSAVGLPEPELGAVLDLATDLSPSEVVEAFGPYPSAKVAAGVRVLVQQVETERGPGRVSLIEAACRLVERLDHADLQAIGPTVAGGILGDIGEPDWPREATPGALLLGIAGGNGQIVDAILKGRNSQELAEPGILERLVPLLMVANDRQVEMLAKLFVSVYLDHPAPMHTAITNAPLPRAIQIFDRASHDIDNALVTLAGTIIDADQETGEDSVENPGDRWADLLEAAMTRTDEAGELISKILELGQRSDLDEVAERVRELEDEALERITDIYRRNLHALLGLERAPLVDIDFWTGHLAQGTTNPEQAANAFARLCEALPGANETISEKIARGADAIAPHLVDETEDCVSAVQEALGQLAWPTTDTDPTANRSAAYQVALSLRQFLENPQALDAVLTQDFVRGLDSVPGSAQFASQAIHLVAELPTDTAEDLERTLGERATTAENLVATLRLRLAAQRQLDERSITAEEILEAKGIEGDKETLSQWLALQPPLAEAQKVLGRITVYLDALGRYARSLNIDDRTTLWSDLEGRGFNVDALARVGEHGIRSAAIDRIAKKISEATQQKERDDLVNRILQAKWSEKPRHKAATDLVLALLNSGVQGNIPLAAKVAIHSSGVASISKQAVRTAFDSALASRASVISKADVEKIRKLGLTTRPKRGLLSFLGG